MTAIVGNILGSMAARLASSLIHGASGRKHSFAELLAAEGGGSAAASGAAVPTAAPSARQVHRVALAAKRLLGLPVTSGEAERIAAGLWALVEDLKSGADGPVSAGDVKSALDDFVSRISGELMLSGDDQSRLAQVVEDYALRELPEAVGLIRTSSEM
ncbi:MAG: hypothetical protein J7M19_10375 [Planctomycetes bacterium]|nr:hypothetical protein [Planctomycetota bacterium]